MRTSWKIASLVAAPLVGGCLAEEVGPCGDPTPVEVDPTGAHSHYVVSRIDLPDGVAESNDFGQNLNCDEQGRPNNALGQIIGMIANHGQYDLDAEAQVLIDAGEILHLVDVQATSLDDAEGVGVTLAHGRDVDGDPGDNFDGAEPFEIRADWPRGSMSGHIEQGQLHVDLGTAPVAITFPGLDEPFVLELHAARIDATIDEDGLEGTIAGAIPEEAVDSELIPVLREGLSRIVARDCDETGCVPESFGELLLAFFDDDQDGAITEQELRDNSLAGSLLAPDVDLFDAGGAYGPGLDGVKESLSVGLCFTAVPAVITD